jgi:predicted DNA-binding protein (MmcQ/YjbR family)
MNVDQVRTYCLAFPGATETLQWGDALCFKINGKMFAVLGLDHVRLTFKCTSEQFVELIERQDIRPSPYLGRHNWVMLERLDALQNDELRALIRQSYEMVAAKAPNKRIQKPGQTKQRIKEKTTSRKRGAKKKQKKRKML